MEKGYGKILSREDLINKYGLSEEEQVYLLDMFIEIEDEVFKFLSAHV
ncbi:MAG: hypothetical protein ACOWWR_07995 [Eubacteriales bacterium]